MSRQTSIQVTKATDQQVELLKQRGFGSFTDIVRIAIDRMAQQEGIMPIRRYTGFDQSIVGGEFTEEELQAARACGSINAFRRGLFEVIDERSGDLPDGWMLYSGHATHSYDPAPPAGLPAAILMGFVRVHHGAPHYPVWLHKRKLGQPVQV